MIWLQKFNKPETPDPNLEIIKFFGFFLDQKNFPFFQPFSTLIRPIFYLQPSILFLTSKGCFFGPLDDIPAWVEQHNNLWHMMLYPGTPHRATPTSFAMMVFWCFTNPALGGMIRRERKTPLPVGLDFLTARTCEFFYSETRGASTLYTGVGQSILQYGKELYLYYIGEYTMWVYYKYHIIHLYNHCIYALMFGTAGSCGNKILGSTTSRLSASRYHRPGVSPHRNVLDVVPVQCPSEGFFVGG